jgi:hypothetical protein
LKALDEHIENTQASKEVFYIDKFIETENGKIKEMLESI